MVAFGWSWFLVLRQRSLGELPAINITWGWEVSGGPTSWTQLSHLRGSGPTLGQSTETLPATWLRRKGRKKKKNRQNPKTNGKSNTKQTKSHKEKYTHTLTKRGKKERKRATKPINKPQMKTITKN